jgi:hypothetical protein
VFEDLTSWADINNAVASHTDLLSLTNKYSPRWSAAPLFNTTACFGHISKQLATNPPDVDVPLPLLEGDMPVVSVFRLAELVGVTGGGGYEKAVYRATRICYSCCGHIVDGYTCIRVGWLRSKWPSEWVGSLRLRWSESSLMH